MDEIENRDWDFLPGREEKSDRNPENFRLFIAIKNSIGKNKLNFLLDLDYNFVYRYECKRHVIVACQNGNECYEEPFITDATSSIITVTLNKLISNLYRIEIIKKLT